MAAESTEATGTAVTQTVAKLTQLQHNLDRVVRGKSSVVKEIVVALVAGGSVLLEDVPGVGKTTMAKALAASLGLSFKRVQCTPDLLPADIFGFSVFNPKDGEFRFRPGPIFCNVLLVDEINRASSRTQSALLEAMAERQVTIEGKRYELSAPFMVLATQNPHGFHGTFQLPESQLDRFLFRLSLDYPDLESEVEILFDQVDSHPLTRVTPVLSLEEVLECQALARGVHVERCIAEYMVEIVRRTRTDARVRLGGSPRSTLMLFRSAQARAFADGRDYVLPDDVQHLAPLVLQHRLVAGSGTEIASAASIVEDILQQVDVPV